MKPPGQVAAVGVAMLLAAVSHLAGVSSVGAAEAAPVAGGSWYFQPQLTPVDTPAGPVAPPALLPTPDVPRGDFAVSAYLGAPNKETYLHVDPNAVAAGSTVDRLSLTLKESAGGSHLLPDTAKINAHPVVGYWSDGSEAAAWTNRPDFDASVVAAGTRAPDGTWTFDLTAIGRRWAEGMANNGVALVAATPVVPETWQVVWSGASPRPFTEGIVQLPPVEPAADAGLGAETPPATDAGPGDAPAVDLDAPSAVPATTLSPAPSAVAEKQASRAAAALRGVRPVVSEGRVKRAPPWTFYVAAVAVVGLLLIGGIALGDRGEPLPERRGSVLRTLERRTTSEP